MEGEVLTRDTPKCAESVDTMYPYGVRARLHEQNVIRAVQEQILQTHKGKLLAPYSATLVTSRGVLGALCNTENVSVMY